MGGINETQAPIRYAKRRVRAFKRRTIYSGLVLFASMAFVYLSLSGHPLHAYWNYVKYIMWASLGLLYLFLDCLAGLWTSWRGLREFERQSQAQD